MFLFSVEHHIEGPLTIFCWTIFLATKIFHFQLELPAHLVLRTWQRNRRGLTEAQVIAKHHSFFHFGEHQDCQERNGASPVRVSESGNQTENDFQTDMMSPSVYISWAFHILEVSQLTGRQPQPEQKLWFSDSWWPMSISGVLNSYEFSPSQSFYFFLTLWSMPSDVLKGPVPRTGKRLRLNQTATNRTGPFVSVLLVTVPVWSMFADPLRTNKTNQDQSELVLNQTSGPKCM